MRRIIGLIVSALFLLFISSCSSNDIPTNVKDVNFEKLFNEYNGTFKLYDISKNTYIGYNETAFDKQDTPCSTFKIMLSLIALQTNVLKDENSSKKWDGTNYSIKEWNKDQTLSSAMHFSVEWFFQELSQQIGREALQDYINKVGYGNQRIGNEVKYCWEDDSLQISVNEQLNFITRLYKEDLPFDKSVIKTVKKILFDEKGTISSVFDKTGTSDSMRNPRVGWCVGYVLSDNNAYTFVTKIEGYSEVTGPKAQEISKKILKELKIFS